MDATHPYNYLLINVTDTTSNSPSAPRGPDAPAATPPADSAAAAARSIVTPPCASPATSSELGTPHQQQQRNQMHTQGAAPAYSHAAGCPAEPLTPASVSAAGTVEEERFQTGTTITTGFRGLPYPPMRIGLSLCISAGSWLRGDKSHVLLLQCFRGLGRCVCLGAAILSWVGAVKDTATAVDAIAAALGIKPGSFPLLPSQRRFLAFFEFRPSF